MSNVDFNVLKQPGSRGDILVRDPTTAAGAVWQDTSARESVGGFTCLQSVADFGTFANGGTRCVTVAVSDGGALPSSSITASVGIGLGRDSDELEMDDVRCTVGKVTPGVGYDVVVQPTTFLSAPHGTYLVNTQRK